jgi:hypothetical protein
LGENSSYRLTGQESYSKKQVVNQLVEEYRLKLAEAEELVELRKNSPEVARVFRKLVLAELQGAQSRMESADSEVDVWRAQGGMRALRAFENILVVIDEVNRR